MAEGNKGMKCKEARDRFSSLMEEELLPEEEKELKGHLSSCSDCERNFQKFQETIHRLHSVEDLDPPEGFLAEIQEKLEERARTAPQVTQAAGRGFLFSPRVKLPLQAAAMVAVLFIVLYVTKIIPVPMSPKKAISPPRQSLSEGARPDSPPSSQIADLKGPEKSEVPLLQEKAADRPVVPRPAPAPAGARGSKPVDALKPPEEPALLAKRSDTEFKEDIKAPEAASLEKGRAESHIAGRTSKEEQTVPPAARETSQAREKEITGGVGAGIPPAAEGGETSQRYAARQERRKAAAPGEAASSPPVPPVREIVVRISDRGLFLKGLHDLVGNLGGDAAQTEENVVTASVPAASLPAFEKELSALSQTRPPSPAERTPLGKSRDAEALKRKQAAVKDAESAVGGRILLRIRFLQE
jgi:hypothetical protein